MKKNQHKQAEQNTKNNPSPKKKDSLWLWGGLALFIILGAGAYFYYQPPSTLSAKATPAQIVRGEHVFSENCLSCHGAEAIGENPAQSRGGQKDDGSYIAPALNGKGHTWHHPNEMLFSTVKGGSVAKDSPMRGFKDKLSDDDIVAVLQYVKSLWPDEIQVRHAMRPDKYNRKQDEPESQLNLLIKGTNPGKLAVGSISGAYELQDVLPFSGDASRCSCACK